VLGLFVMLLVSQAGCQGDKTCRGVTAIGAQARTAALLKAGGSVWTWEPGDADPTRKATTPDASGFVNAQLCLRRSTGEAWCDTSYAGVEAARLAGLSNLRQVSSWYDSGRDIIGSECAVLQDNTLTCNLEGEGAAFSQFSQRATGIGNVGVGAGHYCTLTLDGSVVCAPDPQGDPSWSSAAADLTGVENVVSLVRPPVSALSTTGGNLWSLREGQNGEPAGLIYEEQIQGVDGPISQLIAGVGYACALLADGAVFCWADGGDRQDAGYVVQVNLPEYRVAHQITALPQPATALAGGDLFVCALLQDTSVWCWGVVGGNQKSGSLKGSFVESCN